MIVSDETLRSMIAEGTIVVEPVPIGNSMLVAMNQGPGKSVGTADDVKVKGEGKGAYTFGIWTRPAK